MRHRDIGEKACEDRGRDLSDVSTSQVMLGATRSCKKDPPFRAIGESAALTTP